MNDPKRWLDDDTSPSESRELLRGARGPVPLDAAARARSRRRVAALAAMPVAAAFSWWPALAVGAVIGAAGSVTVMSAFPAAKSPAVVVASRVEAPAPAPHQQERPEQRPEPAPSAAVLPSPSSTPSAARAPASAALAAEAPRDQPPAGDGLEREIELVERARRSLSSDPNAARLALLEHEREFPGGQLRVEREFLMVDALVRLGRRPEAEARAAALEVQAPKTLYGERLDRILGRKPR